MPWSESPVPLIAKNGFCDRHPDIQLRKRNWRGKEKILLQSCPRCDKEHLLQMEQIMQSDVESSRQKPLNNSNASLTSSLQSPEIIRGSSTGRGRLAQNRFAMMMASSSASARPGYNQSCSAFDDHTAQLAAARSRSCRTGLGNIPESPVDVSPLEMVGVKGKSIRNLSLQSPESPLDISPLDMVGVKGRSRRNLGVQPPDPDGRRSQNSAASSRRLFVPPVIRERPVLKTTSSLLPAVSRMSNGAKKKDPPTGYSRSQHTLSTDPLSSRRLIDSIHSCSRNNKIGQPIMQGEVESVSSLEDSLSFGRALDCPESISTAVNATPPAAVEVPADKVASPKRNKSRNMRSRSPRRNLKVTKSGKMTRDNLLPNDQSIPSVDQTTPKDPMELAKARERQRRKVGAVSMDNGSILQDMKAFANYGTEAMSDLVRQPSTIAPVVSKSQKMVNALKDVYEEDEEKTRKCLNQLQAFCQENEDNQEGVLKAGGIEAIVEAMDKFPSHHGIQDEACWVLGTLAINDEQKSAIAEKGGLRAIILAMYLLETNAEFQATCLEVTNHLVDDHMLNKVVVCELGGISPIVTAMNEHSANTRVLGLAIMLLANIAADCGVAKTMIIEAGGIAAIFSAMMAHKASAEIQECGCGFIANLSCSNNTAKFMVSQSGGIGFILTAMKNHGPDPRVQEHALYALQNLAYDCLDTKNMIIEYGGLGPILDVMKSQRSEPTVISVACETIIMLIHRHESAKDAAYNFGAVKGTLSLLEDATLSAATHQSACQVLMNMTHNHTKNKERIAAGGGFPIILACLLNRPMDASLLEAGLKCLTSLTVNDQNKFIMNDACGIDVVVASMKNHPQHIGIQEAGVRTFLNLNCCSQIHAAIIECGGVEAILEAMENHLESIVIQEKASICLLELAVTCANKTDILVAGGLDLLLAAIKFNGTHSGVCKGACSALEALTAHDEPTRFEIAESLGFEAFDDAMRGIMRKADAHSQTSRGSDESSVEFAVG